MNSTGIEVTNHPFSGTCGGKLSHHLLSVGSGCSSYQDHNAGNLADAP